MKNTKELHLHLKDSKTNINFCKVTKKLWDNFDKKQPLRYYLEKWAKLDGLGTYCLNTVEQINNLKQAVQKHMGAELLDDSEVHSKKDTYGLCRIWVTKHIRREVEWAEKLENIRKENERLFTLTDISPDTKFSLVLHYMPKAINLDRQDLDELKRLCLTQCSAEEIVKQFK